MESCLTWSHLSNLVWLTVVWISQACKQPVYTAISPCTAYTYTHCRCSRCLSTWDQKVICLLLKKWYLSIKQSDILYPFVSLLFVSPALENIWVWVCEEMIIIKFAQSGTCLLLWDPLCLLPFITFMCTLDQTTSVLPALENIWVSNSSINGVYMKKRDLHKLVPVCHSGTRFRPKNGVLPGISKTRNGTEWNGSKSKIRPWFLLFSITKALSKALCLVLASSATHVLPYASTVKECEFIFKMVLTNSGTYCWKFF